MPHRSYKITPTDPWAAGVVGVNFDPSQHVSEVMHYRPGTLLVQDEDTDNGHTAGRLWQLSPFQGDFVARPGVQEITPQNAINVVTLGADPTGRLWQMALGFRIALTLLAALGVVALALAVAVLMLGGGG